MSELILGHRRMLWIVLVSAASGVIVAWLPQALAVSWPVALRDLMVTLSYFTVWSNIAVVVVTAATLAGSQGRLASAEAKTAVAVYLTLTGSVYHLLLADLVTMEGPDVYSDYLMHSITPLLYLAYWAIFVRPQPLARSLFARVLLMPLAFISYWMVRGPLVNQYPYFFIDLNTLSVGRVVLNSVGFALVLELLALLFFGLSALTLRPRHTAPERKA